MHTTMLQMRFLGEPEVLRDGVAVPLPASKKSRALLVYLAATGRAHLRERLCELLWDGPDDPRAALRWSLTKLRPVVDPHLIAGRDHVELQSDGARVDLRELCTPATATTDQLIACASLFRGEFAEGLDLPGCFRFQQWCSGERERFRQQHVAILAELSERLAGDARSIEFARRHVQIDPFSEEAHATLIRLLAAHGNRQDALQQYEHCRNVFERELGTRPGAIVEDARRSIGSEWKNGKATGGAEERDRLFTTTFVGRSREIAAIIASTRPALILGEPGIGKSRLLDEIRRRAKGTTLYGRAYAAEMARPYGVWIDALADFPNETDRTHLFDAVAAKMTGIDILAIDDLQWIDEASAALLHYVARKTNTRIVCTARAGEVDDNPYAARLLREFTHIALGPLSKDETLALVASAPDRDRVVENSGGNPLFALELARSESAGTLMQLIGGRLAQLDGPARDLVSWAAALGRNFDAGILGRASEMPAGEMLAALEKLEARAIIRGAEAGGSFDFTHDLIRDAAYQAISGPRRLLVHRHIARALQSVHDPDAALAGEIMRHASIAGDHALAVLSAIEAGQRCLRLFAYADAMNVVRLGLQLAESLPDRERIEREMSLLDVVVMCRVPVVERMQYAPRITELIERARLFGLTAAAALGAHLLACLHAEADDLGGAAVETLRSTEMSRGGDPRATAYVMANTARCLLLIERDIPRAQLLLTEVEAIVNAVGGDHIEIPLGLGYLHAHRGENERAVAHLERALQMAAHEQDHWREWTAAVRLATLALESGELDAAARYLERLRQVTTKMSGGSEGVRTEVLAVLLAFARGDRVDVRAALDQLREIDSKSDLSWALAFIATLELQQGDVKSARRDAEEAIVAADAVGRGSEAALARSILAKLSPAEAENIVAPSLEPTTWMNLSERARERVLECTKEKHHGQHDRRANV